MTAANFSLEENRTWNQQYDHAQHQIVKAASEYALRNDEQSARNLREAVKTYWAFLEPKAVTG